MASKTGTLATTSINDVGIIDLPNGGHVVVAVYTDGWKNATEAEQERVIADISRAVYDYFRFEPHS